MKKLLTVLCASVFLMFASTHANSSEYSSEHALYNIAVLYLAEDMCFMQIKDSYANEHIAYLLRDGYNLDEIGEMMTMYALSIILNVEDPEQFCSDLRQRITEVYEEVDA